MFAATLMIPWYAPILSLEYPACGQGFFSLSLQLVVPNRLTYTDWHIFLIIHILMALVVNAPLGP